MSAAPSSIVTLVHGTWAKDSRWPALEKELTRNLIGPVDVLYWTWTARNRAQARATAAEALRERLRADRAQYPEANHYVIAHSHAGNIALHAVADDGDRLALTGL